MSQPDFADALRRVQGELAERELPASVDRRLAETLDGPRKPKQTGISWPLLVTAGAAVAVAVILFVAVDDHRVGDPKHDVRHVAGFRVTTARGDVQAEPGGVVTVTGDSAELVDEAHGTTITATGPARLARTKDGIRLHQGRVVFEVNAVDRKKRDAVRVIVSHGVIRVIGTRFTVVQRPASGEVALAHGRIEFVATDGRRVALSPGETLTWPLADVGGAHDTVGITDPEDASEEGGRPPDVNDASPIAAETGPREDTARPADDTSEEPAPDVRVARKKTPKPPKTPKTQKNEPRQPKPQPPQEHHDPQDPPDPPPKAPPPEVPETKPTCKLATVLKRVAALRSRGQHSKAAGEIREALKLDCGPGSRPRLSFELGSYLTYHHSNKQRACAFWKRHTARYGSGAYATEIRNAQKHLACNTLAPTLDKR